MIRVAFDDQIFIAQHRGGVSKYFVELITRLPDHNIEPVLLMGPSLNVHAVEAGLVKPARKPAAPVAAARWASWRLWGIPRTFRGSAPEANLLHYTFTHPSYLQSSMPSVSVMHDMTPELFPREFPLGNPHFAKRKFMERSDAIIAISQNTANDMYGLYSSTLAAKTTVIPHGVHGRFFERRPDSLVLPERYVLYVGVRGGYKDFTVFLEAFAEIARTDARIMAVVVGGGEFSRAERGDIQRHGLQDRVQQLFPSDADIAEVYRRATAFIFPSRYEGFGLPILEALASGTPCVLADGSCMREIAGQHALYFPPQDVRKLVDQMRIAMGQQYRMTASEDGVAHAAEYSWDRTAGMTADLYRALIAEQK